MKINYYKNICSRLDLATVKEQQNVEINLSWVVIVEHLQRS
jgi:hypothetical protein